VCTAAELSLKHARPPMKPHLKYHHQPSVFGE
jgi:hypothetical protein